jgi:hypothetical protein
MAQRPEGRAPMRSAGSLRRDVAASRRIFLKTSGLPAGARGRLPLRRRWDFMLDTFEQSAGGGHLRRRFGEENKR